MAAKYPSIPDPTIDPTSLRDSLLAVKQAFEIFSGQRGGSDDAAVTRSELASMPGVAAGVTGILKATAGAISAATAGSDYMHPGTTSTITRGFALAPYNIGTFNASFTPDPTLGNYQYATRPTSATNVTVNVPASDCAIDILITNSATSGSFTFSGYTVNSNTGEPLTTTSGNKFIISIRRINGVSTYVIKALQ